MIYGCASLSLNVFEQLEIKLKCSYFFLLVSKTVCDIYLPPYIHKASISATKVIYVLLKIRKLTSASGISASMPSR